MYPILSCFSVVTLSLIQSINLIHPSVPWSSFSSLFIDYNLELSLYSFLLCTCYLSSPLYNKRLWVICLFCDAVYGFSESEQGHFLAWDGSLQHLTWRTRASLFLWPIHRELSGYKLSKHLCKSIKKRLPYCLVWISEHTHTNARTKPFWRLWAFERRVKQTFE